MKTYALVMAAGSGSRLGAEKNKALLPLLGQALLCHAVRALLPHSDWLAVVVKPGEEGEVQAALDLAGLSVNALLFGGNTRRQSVENALNALPAEPGIVLVHDAARPFASARLIKAVKDAARQGGAAVPALPVSDTLRRQERDRTFTTNREGLFLVQTPQGFQKDLLLQAYQACPDSLTDDASLVERLGHAVALTPGDARNFKVTTREDFDMAEQLLAAGLRVGMGYDVHRLVPDRPLILCGVEVPHETGLLGHSDADVALHALTDALLGACALGDIGRHFPDNEERYYGVSSLLLLQKTREIMQEHGFLPWQVDVTLLCQRPRLAPFIQAMRENIAQALRLPQNRVSVKATTTEGLGFEGRQEGISAQAVATVVCP